MNKSYIFSLVKPCNHRDVSLIDNGDGTILLDGQKFETMGECEKYLESIPRKDLNEIKEETTDLDLLKKGYPYTHGKILRIYYIELYTIIKALHEDYGKTYHIYIGDKDCNESFDRIEDALAGCIAYRYEGSNHKADYYFMKSID